MLKYLNQLSTSKNIKTYNSILSWRKMRGWLKLKLRNKVILFICLLLLIGIIFGYSTCDERKNIYNNNDKIVQDWDSYSYMYNSRTWTGNSRDKINIKYSGFSGYDTIFISESKEDGEVTFNFDSIVNSGDFKAVLINPQKEIENILEGTEQGSKTLKLAKGKYRFKIVGRNAKGEINISINKNNNVVITNFDDK